MGRQTNMWSDSDGESSQRLREMRPGRPSGTELAPASRAFDPAVYAAAAAAAAASPRVEHLDVDKTSQVHVGPSFVSVTQTLYKTEVVTGYALGLELEAEVGHSEGKSWSKGWSGKTRAQRLQCSVAVFVCWSLVVAVALALYLLCDYLLTDRSRRLDLDITEPWYLRRVDWMAMPAYGPEEKLKLPVRYALLGHSARTWCDERFQCTEEVLEIQRMHQRIGWEDIGPNFLISGNGLVFEGSGVNIVGAMVYSWNDRAVTIMFLGDYRPGHDSPSKAQLQSLAELLAALVRAGVLHHQYRLLGHCQVASNRNSPGMNVVQELKNFDHWDSTNASLCIRRKKVSSTTLKPIESSF